MNCFMREKLRRFSLWVLAQTEKFTTFKGGIILTYHSIDPSGSPISVHPDVFRWQMEHLKNSGRKGVSLSEYLRAYAVSPADTSHLIALTFDDGFDSFDRLALPVLVQHGFTATVFVVTGYVGNNCTWDKMEGIPDLKLMDWHQVHECHTQGIEIGSHTIDHPHLTHLNHLSIEKQVVESKEELERLLNTEGISFCYPYGEYDENVMNQVQKAGYRAAVTSRFEYDRSRMNCYDLPRLGMSRIHPTDHEAQKLHFQAVFGGMLPFYHHLKETASSPHFSRGLRRRRIKIPLH